MSILKKGSLSIMSDGQVKKKNKFLERLRSIKHIEIYVAVIFGIIMILIYLSTLNTNQTKTNSTTQSTTTTVTQYIDKMEYDLEKILAQMKGVSKVSVMISLVTEELTVENSNISVSTFPSIKGVVVVAKGVNDTFVRLNVLKAVQAVIKVSNGSIEILSSN